MVRNSPTLNLKGIPSKQGRNLKIYKLTDFVLICSHKQLHLQHDISRSLKRKEQKEQCRGKVMAQYAKKKVLDQFSRITAYKLHYLNREVEKLMAKVKVNSGL